MMKSRIQQVEKCFHAHLELSLQDPDYRNFTRSLFRDYWIQDIPNADVSCLPEAVYQKSVAAHIITKETMILAGIAELLYILEPTEIVAKNHFSDGQTVPKDQIVLTLQGPIASILGWERTLLNVLQRLCGIASLTAQFVDKIGKSECRIAGTRKTLWGLLDKHAIQCGGGLSHRLNLSDAVILKENHFRILRESGDSLIIQKSLEEIIARFPKLRFLEIEVTNSDEFRQMCGILAALPTQIPRVIMFDHFVPAEIRQLISEAKTSGQYGDILFEASGNISLSTVYEYANSGVDVISSGALTHSVPSKDLTLLID